MCEYQLYQSLRQTSGECHGWYLCRRLSAAIVNLFFAFSTDRSSYPIHAWHSGRETPSPDTIWQTPMRQILFITPWAATERKMRLVSMMIHIFFFFLLLPYKVPLHDKRRAPARETSAREFKTRRRDRTVMNIQFCQLNLMIKKCDVFLCENEGLRDQSCDSKRRNWTLRLTCIKIRKFCKIRWFEHVLQFR